MISFPKSTPSVIATSALQALKIPMGHHQHLMPAQLADDAVKGLKNNTITVDDVDKQYAHLLEEVLSQTLLDVADPALHCRPPKNRHEGNSRKKN